MPLSADWLEAASWASQVILVLLTVVAVFAARHQISTFKLFELLKFIQEEKFRIARRRVILDIGPKRSQNWWEDRTLEADASTCCAQYDIVGNILIFGGSSRLTRHFVKHWSDSIIRTYEILQEFIERRAASGGNSYSSYQWLYRRALKHRRSVGAAWPSTSGGSS